VFAPVCLPPCVADKVASNEAEGEKEGLPSSYTVMFVIPQARFSHCLVVTGV
jgi:hypothetical protein